MRCNLMGSSVLEIPRLLLNMQQVRSGAHTHHLIARSLQRIFSWKVVNSLRPNQWMLCMTPRSHPHFHQPLPKVLLLKVYQPLRITVRFQTHQNLSRQVWTHRQCPVNLKPKFLLYHPALPQQQLSPPKKWRNGKNQLQRMLGLPRLLSQRLMSRFHKRQFLPSKGIPCIGGLVQSAASIELFSCVWNPLNMV